MKNTIVLISVFLGSSLLASGFHHNSFSLHTTYKRFGGNSGPVGAIYIMIDKSDYELHVYDSKGWYGTYPVVFGNNTLSDKKMEGDRNTPEGTFHIISKRIHEQWYRFMAIDYPTQ